MSERGRSGGGRYESESVFRGVISPTRTQSSQSLASPQRGNSGIKSGNTSRSSSRGKGSSGLKAKTKSYGVHNGDWSSKEYFFEGSERNFAVAKTSVNGERSGGLMGRVSDAMNWTIHTFSSSSPTSTQNGDFENYTSAVDSLEDLFSWKNKWKTGRAFFGGLYLLFCLKVYMTAGAHIVQPSTAIAAVAFSALFFNSVIRMRCITPFQETAGKAASRKHACKEAMFLDNVARYVAILGHQATSIIPPFIALVARHLSGGQGASSFYLGIVLWLFMLLGEMRVISQIGMLMLAYASLFILPVAYHENQLAFDSLVASLWKGVLTVCSKEHRKEVWIAVLVGSGLGWMLNVGLVARATAGVICACLVLFLRMMPSAKPAETGDVAADANTTTTTATKDSEEQ